MQLVNRLLRGLAVSLSREERRGRERREEIDLLGGRSTAHPRILSW